MLEVTFDQLLSMVMEKGEISITLPFDEAHRARKGVTQAKYRMSKEMENNGLLPETSKLSFHISRLDRDMAKLVIKTKLPNSVTVLTLDEPLEDDITL